MSYNIQVFFKIKSVDLNKVNINKFLELFYSMHPKGFSNLKGEEIKFIEFKNKLFSNSVDGRISIYLLDENKEKHNFIFYFRKINLSVDKYFLYFVLSTPQVSFEIDDNEDNREREFVLSHMQYLVDYIELISSVFNASLSVCCHEITLDMYGFEFEDLIFWLTYFPPGKVKKIGVEKFLNAPVIRSMSSKMVEYYSNPLKTMVWLE